MFRRPRLVFKWVKIKRRKAVECTWSLIGANGEHICGSWPEGYRDKTDAKRAFATVVKIICNEEQYTLREYGPGPRPDPEATP